MSRTLRHFIVKIVLATAVAGGICAVPPATAHAAVVGSSTAATAPGMPKFGDKGPAVTALQKAIMRNGFTLRGGATGVFDKRTRSVLRTFQRIVGLKVTGVVDTATASVLKLSTDTAAPSPATPAVTYPFTAETLPVRGNTGSPVLLVQKALASTGIAVQGGVDGMFGKGTTATIAAFQASKGLPSTGLLDPATAAALNLIAPSPAPTAAVVKAKSSPVKPRLTLATLPYRGQKGANVRVLQKALVKAGTTVKGGIDGVFGGATATALQKFQKAKGLRATGKLDLRTAAALGLVEEQASPISVFPVQGPCGYENTWHAPRGENRVHLGVDIIAKEMNLLYAVADGTITKVYVDGRDVRSGNGVRITTADGTYFFYGHMHHVAEGITLGTKVKAGQVVGYVGKTGATSTPHLHFEIHPQGGDAVDPTPYVAAVDACDVTDPLPVPQD